MATKKVSSGKAATILLDAIRLPFPRQEQEVAVRRLQAALRTMDRVNLEVAKYAAKGPKPTPIERRLLDEYFNGPRDEHGRALRELSESAAPVLRMFAVYGLDAAPIYAFMDDSRNLRRDRDPADFKRVMASVDNLRLHATAAKPPASVEASKPADDPIFRTARWFTRNTMVSSSSLRKAVERRRPLRTDATPAGQKTYSVVDAMKLWPGDIAEKYAKP